TLSHGAEGEDVLTLHNTLRRLGYDIPTDEIKSGLFGAGTLEALRMAQARCGIEPSGIADQLTLTTLASRLQELVGQNCGQEATVPENRTVHGVVRLARGGFLVGATIRAFDVALRHEHKVGEAKTDSCGRYRISYKLRPPSQSDVEK